jgi:hypothetical protein
MFPGHEQPSASIFLTVHVPGCVLNWQFVAAQERKQRSVIMPILWSLLRADGSFGSGAIPDNLSHV